jgi:hypothetical protein
MNSHFRPTPIFAHHMFPLRAAVRDILAHPHEHAWTVQGLGMLRCYPFDGSDWRLNVWHSSFRVVPPASDMHDHPWNLTSWIIAGRMYNQRYIGVEEDMPGDYFDVREIMCGVGADNKTPPQDAGTVKLGRRPLETYRTGDVYSQRAEEIHSTTFDDGSVTLNYRERVNGDAAKIFMPHGTPWIDAQPRAALEGEVARGCAWALLRIKEEEARS